MNVPLPPPSRQPTSLFTPNFGQEPHLLVGREELMQSLMEGLGAGPRDPRFTSLLLGPRGSGKTVFLNHLGDLARQSGWIVLLDAGTAGVKDRIMEHIMWAMKIYDGVPASGTGRIERTSQKSPPSERQQEAIRPLEWQQEIIRRRRQWEARRRRETLRQMERRREARERSMKWGLRLDLTALAARARQRDVAVLLILDEMHSGEPSELRRLSADLQHITKNEQLPLAFLGAGLSEMKHTLLNDQKMAFFARCNRRDMPPLKSLDAARFLARTVSDAGGSFEGDALTSLSEASGSLPYKMQLVGHYAWMAADAPRHPIDDQAAASGLKEADQIMHERVSLTVWHDLNEGQRTYLRRLAELGGEASPTLIAAGMDDSSRNLGRVLTHLTNAGCVTMAGGMLRAADTIPLAGLQQIIAHENLHGGEEPEKGSNGPNRTRCNEIMPRAKARCILTRGHAGAHRSR